MFDETMNGGKETWREGEGETEKDTERKRERKGERHRSDDERTETVMNT